jgi:hypothetical protein
MENLGFVFTRSRLSVTYMQYEGPTGIDMTTSVSIGSRLTALA